MSDIAIKVENLSKLYRIGRAQSHGDFLRSQRHDTLRDALVDGLLPRIARRNGSSNSGNSGQEREYTNRAYDTHMATLRLER